MLGSSGNYSVNSAGNGLKALELMKRFKFDLVITDWLMPELDGIGLIRRIRSEIKPAPPIIMLTALGSEESRRKATEVGCDEYVVKPITTADLRRVVVDVFERMDAKVEIKKGQSTEPAAKPPFVAVAIASSTGGPQTLTQIFKSIPAKDKRAAILIAQHGPDWMLRTFADRLSEQTSHDVILGADQMTIEPGKVYVAPGGKHMKVDPKRYTILIEDGPKINFVKPSADPLFESCAKAFGKHLTVAVLTGLGKDAASTLPSLESVGASIIAQDPETAVAPSMPSAALETGARCLKTPLSAIGTLIAGKIAVSAKALETNG